MKRFLCYLLVVIVLFININSLEVSADGDDAAFVSALSTFLGHSPSEDEKGMYSLLITTLKTDGCTANAIAGVMGNVKHESGGSPFAIEGYSGKKSSEGVAYSSFSVGNTYTYTVHPSLYTNKSGKTMGGCGHGMIQWSFDRATNLSNLASKFSHVTVTHYFKSYDSNMQSHTCKIPNFSGQVAFICEELSGSYAGVKSSMNSASSAGEAGKIFCQQYEKPSNNKEASVYQPRMDSANAALPVVEACTGLVGNVGGDGGAGGGAGSNDGASAVAEYLVGGGYWTEDQLSAYCKLTEINIQELYLDGATREALTQEELSGLANWQLNVKMQEEEHGFIRFLRTLSMFIGILLVTWAMLFYTSYWVDKTNSVIPIEFVFLLSFGKLRISGDENDSTYSFNTDNNAKVKAINHKDCIFICVVAVGAGFLLITGIFYSIVQGFVNTALRFLGRV